MAGSAVMTSRKMIAVRAEVEQPDHRGDAVVDGPRTGIEATEPAHAACSSSRSTASKRLRASDGWSRGRSTQSRTAPKWAITDRSQVIGTQGEAGAFQAVVDELDRSRR